MPTSLSREDMEQVINDGGSVLHGGVIHTSHDTLPSAAALAKGDATREAAVRQGIESQIAALSGQLASLEAPAEKPRGEEPRAEEKPKK